MARGELAPTPVFGVSLKTTWRGPLLLSPASVSLSLAPCLSFSFPPSICESASFNIHQVACSFRRGLP